MKKRVTMIVCAIMLGAFGAGIYAGLSSAAGCSKCNPRTCTAPCGHCECRGCVYVC